MFLRPIRLFSEMLVAEIVFKISRNPAVSLKEIQLVVWKERKNGPISLQSCVHLTLTSNSFEKYNCLNLQMRIWLIKQLHCPFWG